MRTGIKEKNILKAIEGSIYVHRVAMIAPAALMKKALIANVITFIMVTLMPIWAAASPLAVGWMLILYFPLRMDSLAEKAGKEFAAMAMPVPPEEVKEKRTVFAFLSEKEAQTIGYNREMKRGQWRYYLPASIFALAWVMWVGFASSNDVTLWLLYPVAALLIVIAVFFPLRLDRRAEKAGKTFVEELNRGEEEGK